MSNIYSITQEDFQDLIKVTEKTLATLGATRTMTMPIQLAVVHEARIGFQEVATVKLPGDEGYMIEVTSRTKYEYLRHDYKGGCELFKGRMVRQIGALMINSTVDSEAAQAIHEAYLRTCVSVSTEAMYSELGDFE